MGWLGYLLRRNNTRKQQNNNQTNNPHKTKTNQKMIAPSLNLCVTPSSSAPFFQRGRGPLSFPGSHPNSPARASLVPPEFARSLLLLWRPQEVSGAEQDPGVVGYAPLRLAGTSGGGFSEECPYQPPRLDCGPMRISRG